MKTLKQIFEKYQYLDSKTNEPVIHTNNAKKAFKEWLQQNQKHYMRTPLASILGKPYLDLNELLEELQQ